MNGAAAPGARAARLHWVEGRVPDTEHKEGIGHNKSRARRTTCMRVIGGTSALATSLVNHMHAQ